MTFQDRLKKLRLNKKMTQQEVADKLGLTRQAYGYYENEKSRREPDITSIRKLAELFDVTTDYLLGYSNHPKLTAELEKEVDSETNELMEILDSLPEDKRNEMEKMLLAYAKGYADANKKD